MLFSLQHTPIREPLLRTEISGHFEQVTVLVCDAPDFLAMASHCQPVEVIRCLDELFSSFDRLCSLHNVRTGRRPAFLLIEKRKKTYSAGFFLFFKLILDIQNVVKYIIEEHIFFGL